MKSTPTCFQIYRSDWEFQLHTFYILRFKGVALCTLSLLLKLLWSMLQNKLCEQITDSFLHLLAQSTVNLLLVWTFLLDTVLLIQALLSKVSFCNKAEGRLFSFLECTSAISNFVARRSEFERIVNERFQ